MFLNKKNSVLSLLIVSLFMLINTAVWAGEHGAIKLSAAKSIADTGILQALAREFNTIHPELEIEIQSVGSLQALDHARQLKADLVISHYPHEEQRLARQGFVAHRTQIVRSSFALFGPPGDELGLSQKTNIIDVMQTLAREEVDFVTPSAKGGTYGKIEELWALAGINPRWPGYEYAAISSTAALLQAADNGSYTIADMGVYLANKHKFSSQLVPHYQNDLALQNIYSILVTKKASPNSILFYEYLISDKGQNAVQQLGLKIFNAPIISAIASLDPQLISYKKEQALKRKNKILFIGIGLLSVILILLTLLLLQALRLQKLAKAKYENEKRFRAVVETSPDLIWEIDVNAVYTYISPKIQALLGFDPVEVIGKTLFEFVNAEDLVGIKKRFTDVVKSKHAFFNIEIIHQHKNGELVNIETSGVPVFDKEGEVIAYRGIGRDITERKKTEEENQRLQRELQQAHKMESLGQLTGGIAHDFNNMLSVMLGFAELALLEDIDNEKLLEYLHEINNSGERAQGIVAQMLTFSRNDKSQDEILQLDSIVQSGVEMLRSTIPSSVNFKVEIEDNLPAVLMNKTQLEQILMNLCVNARDAMNGHGELGIKLAYKKNLVAECSISHKTISGDWVVITVSDTGSGIEPEVMEKIFNPFFTTKEIGKGTGMGLAVIYGIVTEHEGAIIVESKPGEGTRFNILFPPYNEASRLAS